MTVIHSTPPSAGRLQAPPSIAAWASRYQLLNAAEALAAEFSHLPAGTVIRCFARAVREARAAGVPPSILAKEAEQLARVLLELRQFRGYSRAGTRAGTTSVPRRRRAVVPGHASKPEVSDVHE